MKQRSPESFKNNSPGTINQNGSQETLMNRHDYTFDQKMATNDSDEDHPIEESLGDKHHKSANKTHEHNPK